MAEFTRGTWTLKPGTAIISANSKCVAYVYALLEDDGEPLANARLIENAPTMFSMLEELSQKFCKDEKEYRQINALIQKIRFGNQVLPCPFCGSKNIEITKIVQEGYFNFSCDNCGCFLYTELTDKDKAVVEWNTRANVERT